MTHPRLLGLDHVVLRVRDLDRARAFYCDVLGCTVELYQEIGRASCGERV